MTKSKHNSSKNKRKKLALPTFLLYFSYMREIDKNKVQVKYITGINKTLFGYPTPLDVLYDSCMLSVDDKLLSKAKMENKYFSDEIDANLIDSKIEKIINSLLEDGYIEKSGVWYKIVKTIWD